MGGVRDEELGEGTGERVEGEKEGADE